MQHLSPLFAFSLVLAGSLGAAVGYGCAQGLSFITGDPADSWPVAAAITRLIGIVVTARWWGKNT